MLAWVLTRGTVPTGARRQGLGARSCSRAGTARRQLPRQVPRHIQPKWSNVSLTQGGSQAPTETLLG